MRAETNNRRWVIFSLFGLVMLVFIARLFFLQVLSPHYAAKAEGNSRKRTVIPATRGVIYDRHDRIYVTNSPTFELTVLPRDLYLPDTSVFEYYLKLDRATLRKRIQAARDFSPNKPSVLATQIDADAYTSLQEHLWATRGITTVVRNTRNYLYPVGANFLGYISEVNKKDIEKSQGYYQQGDFIGTTGLERQYEEYLRGRRGVRNVLVDVSGQVMGEYAGGRLDTLAQKGTDIQITIDVELQRFGEALMEGKLGSIVALEPTTGEVLAFVSSPSYDPNRLANMEFTRQFVALRSDSLRPLYNRALQGVYPPGSIFKILNGLVALELGTLQEHRFYGCAGGFSRNNGRPGCHGHPSPLNFHGAVQHSCNAFFAAAYVDMLHSGRFPNFDAAYLTWYEVMSRFGVGHRLGLDLPNEKGGLLPKPALYNRIYGPGRWKAMTVVSNSIGQGEILMTPLQMANVAAVLANQGYYVQPHFLRQFKGGTRQVPHFDTIRTSINPHFYDVAAEAMQDVVESGTGTEGAIPGLVVCGKTGTAENPAGEDHSVFFAFVPKENPRIAIAVVVENSGFGNTWAAPIASLMMEHYLRGSVSDPDKFQRVRQADFITPPRLRAWGKRLRPQEPRLQAFPVQFSTPAGTPRKEPKPLVPLSAPALSGAAASVPTRWQPQASEEEATPQPHGGR